MKLLLVAIIGAMLMMNSIAIAKHYQIKQVHVITRHGDRTPVHEIPNLAPVKWYCKLPNDILASPLQQTLDQSEPTQLFVKLIKTHGDPLPGNCSAGQLTDIGMRQHYKLGEEFYKKYTSMNLFESTTDLTKQIYVESTDVQRTLQSAESQILGLLSVDRPKSTPIPIHVMTDASCDLYPNYSQCKKLDLIRKQISTSSAYTDFERRMKPLKDHIMSILGVETFPGWVSLYDVFFCRECHNYTLPHGWDQDVIHKIYDAAAEEYQILLSDAEFLRLGMGPFLSRLMDDMKTFRQVTHRYFLHSGHDTSIAPLANILKISDGKWPIYASNIVFELYEDEESTTVHVKVLYNGVDMTQKIFGVDYCAWTNFEASLRKFTLDHSVYVRECNAL